MRVELKSGGLVDQIRTIIGPRSYARARKIAGDARAIFDAEFYVRANPDVAASGADPLTHYLQIGWAEGRDPSPLFDNDWYFEQNPDVAKAGLNPLLHYISAGWKEGRNPSPLFDGKWYLEQYPDVAEAGVNPLIHFIEQGWREGRTPNPLFDADWYLKQNPDVAATGVNPLIHYIEIGAAEGLQPHPLFDGRWYLEQNPDVAEAELNPLTHYLEQGWCENRNPNPLFDTDWYLEQNPDVSTAGQNPLAHYVEHGAGEGLAPHPLFDGKWYLEKNPDVAAAGENPLAHYLTSGKAEGRHQYDAFDKAGLVVPAPTLEIKKRTVKRHLANPRLLGEVSYSTRMLAGWMRCRNHNAPVRLEVKVDGVGVWFGPADRLAFQNSNGSSRTPCGFKILLPIADHSRANRSVEIFVDGVNVFDNDPFIIPNGDSYVGRVEHCETLDDGRFFVSGWCIDIAQPSRVVELDVYAGASFIRRFYADQRRSDLHLLGFDSPYGGFEFQTLEVPDDLRSQLRVVPSGAPIALDFPEASSVAPRTTEIDKKCFPAEATVIRGSIDAVGIHAITGWARSESNPNQLVFLELSIDGNPYAVTAANSYRPDLAKVFGDHGCHAFRFELTPYVTWLDPGRLKVRPLVGDGNITHKYSQLPFTQKKARRLVSKIIPHQDTIESPLRIQSSPKLSVIVLNRNGSALLDRMFASFARWNSYEPIEFKIVDHASTDDSIVICEKWRAIFDVQFLPRGRNYSFSDSNNYGVSHSSGEVLLFFNNDARLGADILPKLVGYCLMPSIGCVGVTLLDDTPMSSPLEACVPAPTPEQHRAVHFRIEGQFGLGAYESRWFLGEGDEAKVVPAVTAAVLACSREVFDQIGGFDEGYFYGYEDVDLCLKLAALGKKVVAANDLRAFHMRGFTRQKMDEQYNYSRVRNRVLLDRKFGRSLRRSILRDRFQRVGYWSGALPRIAFIVTEASDNTLAGDYFTALEFAKALVEQYPCECIFIEYLSQEIGNLTNVDVVIAMRDDFNPEKIEQCEPHLLKVLWARNWFARIPDHPYIDRFDLIWASSSTSAEFLSTRVGRPVSVLPIASNETRFTQGSFDPELACDYCFTGSYWGTNREIMQMLDPAALPFSCAIYGSGWEKVPTLAPYSRGSLPYSRMRDVYKSTRLVIDDANHTTIGFGSVNSRVFDAISAGALVLTNGERGAKEIFGDLLPVYSTPQELEAQIKKYLSDEALRQEHVKALQGIVFSGHTYQHRAESAWAYIKNASAAVRIAIKIGAPNRSVRHEWGDYHYAVGLQQAFEAAGYLVRIDCLNEWNNLQSNGDDVVLILRGLSEYKPKPHQLNLMWQISHPDRTSLHEYRQYDHIFVASQKHAQVLRGILGEKVSTLLQCTDHKRFNCGVDYVSPAPDALFVGNSREQYRKIVADAIEAGIDLSIYGSRWLGFVPDQYIKGEYIPNDRLAAYYRSANVVLNDHWDTMREFGYLSNRLFDAVACGARVVSDKADGIEEVFGSLVATYETVDELRNLCDNFSSEIEERRAERDGIAKEFVNLHSFAVRSKEIMNVIEGHMLSETKLKNANA